MATNGNQGQSVIGPGGYDQGPATLVIAGGMPTPTVGPGDHVVICHALGEGNKNTYVQIAPSAGVVFGHVGAGHQDGEDIIPPFIYEANGNKGTNSSLVTGQNWDAAHIAVYQNGCAALPPAPHVTDLCLNIEGNQETVPVGMIRDAHGNCEAHPPVVITDLCLNIEGNQETVPVGMIRDAHGNCEAHPPVVITDLCLNIEGNQETVPAGMIKNGEGACSTPTAVIVTETVVTPSVPTPQEVVSKALLVAAPVAAKPVGAVLGVSKTKVIAKVKAKAKKAQTKKSKAVKAKVVKAKVTRVRVLPFTP